MAPLLTLVLTADTTSRHMVVKYLHKIAVSQDIVLQHHLAFLGPQHNGQTMRSLFVRLTHHTPHCHNLQHIWNQAVTSGNRNVPTSQQVDLLALIYQHLCCTTSQMLGEEVWQLNTRHFIAHKYYDMYDDY